MSKIMEGGSAGSSSRKKIKKAYGPKLKLGLWRHKKPNSFVLRDGLFGITRYI